ncbi:hypothetical protein O0L34_g6618 [Tuta absoluta]|nr:hypothetical protein O0L34_g6618 [Tuta absoluta]
MKNYYLCFYCNEKFSDPADLRCHNNLHKPERKLIENGLCKMKTHDLVKVDITDVSCRQCDDVITDLSSLKTHLLEMHKERLDPKSCHGVLPFKITKVDFPCALCPNKYEEFTSLNHHMNVHFQYFICETCGSGFISPDRLRSHYFSHETGSFPCAECSKIYRSSNARNEHYDLVHKKAQRHRCPHCPETFKNYYQKNKHITVIHGIKIKEFKCAVCQKVFKSSGKLVVHKQMVHLKLKRYACDACEWKFYSKSELEAHKIKHSGERKHECAVCKKAYARKYTLREHMRIHDNDRRFVCSVCGGGFVQKCSLKHHIKVHHPTVSTSKTGTHFNENVT